MKRIWAPWRINYIKKTKIDHGCFICKLIKDKSENDRKNFLLFRGKNAIVMLNIYPYNSGHLMIAPILHTSELSNISKETSIELWELTTKSLEILKKAFSPSGFNIGINLGKIAGAGLQSHVHIHIVPRWGGDTNFMPVLSETKIISQAIEETYEDLIKHVELYKT